MKPVIHVKQAYYPESDGKPMGETDEHREAMVRHIEVLQDYFQGRQVYVSGDLLVYYEQGNPKKFVVPDAFIVKGVTPAKRRIFKIWVEGKAPDVVIETTSRKTRRKDLVDKPRLYASLGVKEYFLFDPIQEYLEPPLQGYRQASEGFDEIEPDEQGRLISAELGLRLGYGQGKLQFYVLETQERLLSREERAEREAAARRAETEARQAAEAEVAKLRAQLANRPSA